MSGILNADFIKAKKLLKVVESKIFAMEKKFIGYGFTNKMKNAEYVSLRKEYLKQQKILEKYYKH